MIGIIRYAVSYSFLLGLSFIGLKGYTQAPVLLSSGTQWTVPNGVTHITVECWGGGGAGSNSTSAGNSRGGGGGGAYAKKNVIAVTPGQVITYQIGTGGNGGSGTDGSDTWFLNDTVVLAKGGRGAGANADNGGAGGAAGVSVGDVKYSGGNGGNRGGSGNCGGCASGAGGSGAGSSGNGNNGADGGGSGNNASQGGAAVADYGGAGGSGAGSGDNLATGGDNYGGGGGGAKKAQFAGSDRNGGNGANGLIRITTCDLLNQPAAIQGAVLLCDGISEIYSVVNDTNALSYAWSLPSGWSGTSATNSITVTAGANGGTISVSAVNGCGESTPRTLGVNVPNISSGVNVSGSLVTSAESGASSYQWINCSTGSVIAGATGQSYNATANGSYAVVITKDACVDTSDCATVGSVGIDENMKDAQVSIYPNPAYDVVNIVFYGVESSEQRPVLKLVDLTGRTILSRNILLNGGEQHFSMDLGVLASGIYIIRVDTGNHVIFSDRLVLAK